MSDLEKRTINNDVLTYVPQPVVFTDSAAAKVYELIAEEGNDNLKLRVFITGGGCSGFQYGFTFDETVNPDDTIIEKIIAIAGEQIEESDEEGGSDGGESGKGGQHSFIPKNQPFAIKGELAQEKRKDIKQPETSNFSHKDKHKTVQLLIDPMSLQYLLGAEIDYTEGLEGAQFVIRNPQAKTTCGCGSSFSI